MHTKAEASEAKMSSKEQLVAEEHYDLECSAVAQYH